MRSYKGKKIGVFIQAHHTDIVDDMSWLDVLDKSNWAPGAFDNSWGMTICSDFGPENSIFDYLGNIWDIASRHFLPNKDLVGQMRVFAESCNYDVIVRTIFPRFYSSQEVIAQQIKLLVDKDLDYVHLPHSWNVNAGADVLSREAVQKLASHEHESSVKMRPWNYILHHDDEFKSAPCYPREYGDIMSVQEIRNKPSWFERHDLGNYGKYNKFLKLASEHYDVDWFDLALDAACGTGSGTNAMNKYAREVVGADIDFSHCRSEGNHLVYWDMERNTLPDALINKKSHGGFDLIVSCHTLEHLDEPEVALWHLWTMLGESGLLILEVPLEKQFPWGVPVMPSHKQNWQTPQQFVGFVGDHGLPVDMVWAVTRGEHYVKMDYAMQSKLPLDAIQLWIKDKG
jgi:SAM-dependent methyltransferase